MGDAVALLVAVLLCMCTFTGVMYWTEWRSQRYEEGYACAVAFMEAPTRADTLQLRLDGCVFAQHGDRRMNTCTQCGISIPAGQRTCSMCYGDIDHGSDGYYERWAREQMELVLERAA